VAQRTLGPSPIEEGTVVAKILAEKVRLGDGRISADWRHFGRSRRLHQPKTPVQTPDNGLFPLLAAQIAQFSNGVIYEKTHEVLSEVEDRLLEQLHVESRRSIAGTHRLSRNIPGRDSELLDYSHFRQSSFLLKANATKLIFPMPPTDCNEASPKFEIRDTIRTHASTSAFVNRSQRDQDAYIERTVKKALKQNGFSLPTQPAFQSATLCR
jgi:hypothetical protein